MAAQVQVKSHGVVTSNRAKSMKDARTQAQQTVAIAQKCDYRIVGSAPDITMLMCPRHINRTDLPADADFCYIVAANNGR